MNLIEDVVERVPFSREAIVGIDAGGSREAHHFGELFARGLGLSGALAARGVRRGDVVMTLIGNRVEWVIAMLACFRMGAVALPCGADLSRAEVQHRCRVAGPAIAIGEERLLGSLPDGLPSLDLADLSRIFDEDLPQETPASAADLAPDDPALILFSWDAGGESTFDTGGEATSGTGRESDANGESHADVGDQSHAVIHPQGSLAGQKPQAELRLGVRAGELVWCTEPPGGPESARDIFIAPWLCGARALLHDAPFDPDQRLELIRREEVSVLSQPAAEHRMLAEHGVAEPLPSLRRAVTAGGAADPEAAAAFRTVAGLDIAGG